MFKPVVAAIAALPSHAQLSVWQREVIGYDQYIFQRDLLLLHPIPHGIAAKVHIGAWLQKHKGLSLVPKLADVAITVCLKKKIGRPSKGVQYFKSYVVTRLRVFTSNVS